MNDNRIIAKFIIFYRELPHVLLTTYAADEKCRLTKDGVQKCGTLMQPRATIILESKGNLTEDKKRIFNFSNLLDELEKNNQIISFSVKKTIQF